jgi:hypothetical protein
LNTNQKNRKGTRRGAEDDSSTGMVILFLDFVM